MRLPSADEMRRLDLAASTARGLAPELLMEHAGRSVAAWLVRQRPAARDIGILCGSGNNGGDGLVAARLLAAAGRRVRVWLSAEPGRLPPAAATNLARATAAGIQPVNAPDFAPDRFDAFLAGLDVLLDCLLGTGLDRPASGARAACIDAANSAAERGLEVVAVDVPSGFLATGGPQPGPVLRSAATLALGLPKRGMPAPGYPGGSVHVLDIGFPADLADAATARTWLDADWARHALPTRPLDAHKGRLGRILVIAGSHRYPGAASLACAGALASGAGLVECLVPHALPVHPCAAYPEALVRETPAPSGVFGPEALPTALEALGAADALVIGPGLDRHPDVAAFLAGLLPHLEKPALFDADALYHLAPGSGPRTALPAGALCTPHHGEALRMGSEGMPRPADAPEDAATTLAGAWHCTVVLKGASTAIAAPDGRVGWCTSGTPALARGGSGDVLAGLAGGFLARGLDAWQAGCLAVWVHGRAGTLVAERAGRDATRPTLVAEAVGEVLEGLARPAGADGLGTDQGGDPWAAPRDPRWHPLLG